MDVDLDTPSINSVALTHNSPSKGTFTLDTDARVILAGFFGLSTDVGGNLVLTATGVGEFNFRSADGNHSFRFTGDGNLLITSTSDSTTNQHNSNYASFPRQYTMTGAFVPERQYYAIAAGIVLISFGFWRHCSYIAPHIGSRKVRLP